MIVVEQLYGRSEFVPLSEVIEKTKLPKRFVAQIASLLAKKGLLESKEGKVGGYKLSPTIETISLYDFLEYFEDVDLAKCQKNGFVCEFETVCLHKKSLQTIITGIITNRFKAITLKDIITGAIQ